MTASDARSPEDRHHRRWPATVTVLVVLGLQLALPGDVVEGPPWLLPAFEIALLAPLVATNPLRLSTDTPLLRGLAVALAALLGLANAVHLLRLVIVLVSSATVPPRLLVQTALLIWVTNVAAVAIALWELDAGGPFARDPSHDRKPTRPDLLFPQVTGVPGWDRDEWRPGFADYLFVSFTTATAFSPTDTLPLSVRAKGVMALGSGVSLLTVAVVAARAVNIL